MERMEGLGQTALLMSLEAQWSGVACGCAGCLRQGVRSVSGIHDCCRWSVSQYGMFAPWYVGSLGLLS